MSEHIEKKSVYFSIFLALMVGTAVTVYVAFQDLGILNNLVMLGIAVTKATLVVMFFMHARHSSQLTKLTILASVVWLLILFTFILQDYLTRGMLPYPGK
ncbi:MAG: cytochrome C oxidase subunit IV family protein [Candidatus Eisenbacteria bacterium]|nr:cytochrome C oxidase subunit IV family protein [Candidatus Eisenbacteria bacterium]